MLEKFIDNDVMGFERVLRDIEKILLLNTFNITNYWMRSVLSVEASKTNNTGKALTISRSLEKTKFNACFIIC